MTAAAAAAGAALPVLLAGHLGRRRRHRHRPRARLTLARPLTHPAAGGVHGNRPSHLHFRSLSFFSVIMPRKEGRKGRKGRDKGRKTPFVTLASGITWHRQSGFQAILASHYTRACVNLARLSPNLNRFDHQDATQRTQESCVK